MVILQKDRGGIRGLEISDLPETAEYLPFMLAYCRLPFLPEREIGEMDNELHIFYHLNGLLPIRDVWEGNIPDMRKWDQLFFALRSAVDQLAGYMLLPEHLLLHPAYVFTSAQGNYYFLYVPGLEGSFEEHLREFCQQLLRLFRSGDRIALRNLFQHASPLLREPGRFMEMDFSGKSEEEHENVVEENGPLLLPGPVNSEYARREGGRLFRRRKRNASEKRKLFFSGRERLRNIMLDSAAGGDRQDEKQEVLPAGPEYRLPKEDGLTVGTGILTSAPRRTVTRLVPADTGWVQEIRIGEGTGTLGRQKDCCRYVLQAPGVSREHAELRREGRGVWIMDMGSTNGTFINAKRLIEGREVPLHPGDEVCFANIMFTCE